MAKGIHTEETFEALIEAHLLEHGGYEAASPEAYDRDMALLSETVLAFIQDTQPTLRAGGDSLARPTCLRSHA